MVSRGVDELRRNDHDAAEECYVRALVLSRQNPDLDAEAEAHRGLGDVALLRGRPDGAQEQYLASLDLSRRCDNPRLEAEALTQLGELALVQGKLVEAEEQYLAAINLCQLHQEPLCEARARRGLADLARLQGKVIEAEQHYLDAISLSEHQPDRQMEAEARLGLADLARFRHRFEEANQQYRNALGLSHLTNEVIEARARRGLGDIAAVQGDFAEARTQYRRALTLGLRIPDRFGEVAARLGLADLARQQHDLPEAEEQYLHAVALSRRMGHRPGEASAYRGLAYLAAAQGAPRSAVERLQKAIDGFNEIGAYVESAEANGQLAALLDEELGDTAGALIAALNGVRTLGRLRGYQTTREGGLLFDAEHQGLFDIGLSLAYRVNDGLAGLEILAATRDTVISGLLRADLSPDAVDPSIRECIEAVDRQQAALSAAATGIEPAHLTQPLTAESHRVARESLEQSLTEALTMLENRVGEIAHRFAPEPATGEDLLRIVPPDVHYLGYYINRTGGEVSLVIVWVDRDRECHIDRRPISNDFWNDVILDFARGREPLINSETDSLAQELLALADLLLPSDLQRELLNTDASNPARLLVVPAGPLWFVPFCALRIEGTYLVEHASVALTPSLQCLTRREVGSNEGVVGFLDSELDGADKESQHLRALHTHVDLARTAPEFLAMITESSAYSLAVIGAHGDSRRGLGHGLRLSDNTCLLTAGHLLEAMLPQHVTIGACASGAIDLDRAEPISLATVALARGATTVTATRWRIPNSDATAEFHNSFHSELLTTHPAEALRLTQHQIIASQPKAKLWDWAAHTTIGWPTNPSFQSKPLFDPLT